MPNVEFSTIGYSDSDVLREFAALAASVAPGSSETKFSAIVSPGVQVDTASYSDFVQNDVAKVLLESGNGRAMRRIALTIPGKRPITVTYARQQSEEKVLIEYQDNTPAATVALAIRECHDRFLEFTQPNAALKVLGPELAQFYRSREEGLLKLESLTQRLIEQNESYRRELDDQIATKRNVLEHETLAKQTQLEAEFEQKHSVLAEKLAQIAEREKQLDDRHARHARRESVQRIKQVISSRAKSFSLTEDTRRKRLPIHGIFVALLVLSAVVVGVGLFRPPDDTETGALLWLHVLRVPAGIMGFAFAAVFYIRWNDHWFRQHADEEFQLRRLELDVDRASWVTELALEYRDEKGDVPAELLDRLSAGLFSPYVTQAVKHPSQDLLSAILGASTSLKLALPGGIEANLNRGGVKQLQKEIDRA